MESRRRIPERPRRKPREKSPAVGLTDRSVTRDLEEIPPKLIDEQVEKLLERPVRRRSLNKLAPEATEVKLKKIITRAESSDEEEAELEPVKATFQVLVKDVEIKKVPYRESEYQLSPEKETDGRKSPQKISDIKRFNPKDLEVGSFFRLAQKEPVLQSSEIGSLLRQPQKEEAQKPTKVEEVKASPPKGILKKESFKDPPLRNLPPKVEVEKEEEEKKTVLVEKKDEEPEEKMSEREERVMPEPVQVVLAKPKHQFELDEDALSRVLMHPEVRDKHVVVVSVAGAFRKGKSFLLDFFLRYMKAKYSTVSLGKSGQDWLGPDDAPLEGFSWRGGSDRETTGIVMWSEAFIAPLPTGEKVVVVLLDTQGAFDQESTVKDCATVFALSTMVSSVQIYNLSQNIQEDDLMNLQLFTEYGKLALEDSGNKPFQKLTFLVRDWSYPYEADYGAKGGSELLSKRLRIKEEQDPQHQSIRRHIKECFTDIDCFLLPHPGFKVSTKPEFDGRLKDIEMEFVDNLKVLIPKLLAPENLIVKEIGGQRVKAKELVQYFKSYMKIYNSNELPEPKTMLVATAEANNLSAVAAAKETYHQLMEAVCGGAKPYLNTAHLESEHLRIKERAIDLFSKKPKMGGEEFSKQYKAKLDEDLESFFLGYRQANDAKQLSFRSIWKLLLWGFIFMVVAAIIRGPPENQRSSSTFLWGSNNKKYSWGSNEGSYFF